MHSIVLHGTVQYHAAAAPCLVNAMAAAASSAANGQLPKNGRPDSLVIRADENETGGLV